MKILFEPLQLTVILHQLIFDLTVDNSEDNEIFLDIDQ